MFNAENPSPDFVKLIEIYRKIHLGGSSKRNSQKKLAKDTYNGRATFFFADIIQTLIKKNHCKTMLDYGSGKGDFYFEKRKFNNKVYQPLKDFWNIKPTLYDPAVIKLDKPKNTKFDIVISIDVLEHIPLQDLNWVISEILSFSKNLVFINVACYPADVILEDGRNAHVSLFPPMWWYGFITALSSKYNSKIFLVCSAFENKKIKYFSFGINDDLKKYQ